MNQRTYSSIGFVIQRKNYLEADRILTLFTKDFGKITVLARGVRKVTSRKRGGIEVFNKIKISVAKGKGFDILTEVEVVDSPNEIKSDLKRMSVGFYFCEVLQKITRDEEKHLELFSIVEEYFEKLKIESKLKKLRLEFAKEVLISLGFWPEGKEMINPDMVLEGVTERRMSSSRVGKKMLQQD